MFRATARQLQCRITFFTRSPCGLCDTAKAVVQKVNAKRPLDYHEINVMDAGQEKWKNVYEFDTPVVWFGVSYISSEYLNDPQIHVDKVDAPETTTSSLKLMHRFGEEDVSRLMDQAEKA
jgi:hypothetical protein